MLIDTHCHFNLKEYFPDWQSEVDFAVQAGVASMIVVGIDEETSRTAVEMANQRPEIYAVIGVHPNQSHGCRASSFDWIAPLVKSEPKVVAIGEIGLDLHWDDAPLTDQLLSFEVQLEIAKNLQKPVVLHVRDAYPEAVQFLRPKHEGVLLDFHCFAGSKEVAHEVQEWGSCFGFDGPVTYKKAEETRAILASLKQDRILIETDSPFLAPVPFRGKLNRPQYLPYVNQGVASAMGVSAEVCSKITTDNAIRFFGVQVTS